MSFPSTITLPDSIDSVERLDAAIRKLPQVHIDTKNVFHAGMYIRTITIPAETLMTNVHIIIPTVLFVSGHCLISGMGESTEYDGYSIIYCRADRKNAFYAISETTITMAFASDALTVREAEEQFTDEPDNLMSRKEDF